MKKLILSITVIAMVLIIGVGLTACNNATPQGQLANILNDHTQESFIYEAINTKDNTRGAYTVELKAFNKGDTVDFGTRTLDNVSKGIRVKGELSFGKVKYEMGCYYNIIGGSSFMTPAYSYRTIKNDGVQTFAMQGRYDGSTFVCERKIGEDTFNDSAKLSGTVFDNNQFQQVLRSVTTFSSGLTLSFNTPIASAEGVGSATLTASGNSTVKIKDIGYTNAIEDLREEGVECYKISLSRTTEVAGMSQTLYYAVDDVKSNGWAMKHVLMKIVEPFTVDGESYEMQYNLISASIS